LVEAAVYVYKVFTAVQSAILIVVWLAIGDIRRFVEASLYELIGGRFELVSKAIILNLQTILLALLALFVVATIRLYLTQMMGIGPASHLLEVLSVAAFNLDTAALFLGVLAASRVLLLLFPPGVSIRRSESAGEADEYPECTQYRLEFAALTAGLSLMLWGSLWLFVEPPPYSIMYVALVAALTYSRCSRKCCRILDLALSAVPPTGFAVQLL